jgi:hypothetical protein
MIARGLASLAIVGLRQVGFAVYSKRVIASWFALGVLLLSAPARAGPPPDDDRIDDLEKRVDDLERENAALRERTDQVEEEQAFTEQRLQDTSRLAARLHGYFDGGFFATLGDGSGVRSDLGHRLFPEYDYVPDSWVFVGDPLSTAINARGEPADTGPSRAVMFDSVDARNKASMIVNALNVGVSASAPGGVGVNVLVDFVPRGRDVAQADGLFLGDFVDLKLAHLRWITPVRRFHFELQFGKINSVFGREYRMQESPDRVEVTPSLLCRYTCGRPIGLKAKAKLAGNRIILAGSATNGSTYQESFAFYNEVDDNSAKTLTGRAAVVLPVGSGLEIGASGMIGAQDLQDDDGVLHWQHGFDAHLGWRGLELTAELLQGRATGKTTPGSGIACDLAPCLRVMGAYGSIGYRVRNWLMPYFRSDWRDAEHLSGADFVYISQLVRFTPGLRFDAGTNLAVKVQYTLTLEVDRVPQIPNDVFTSSVVAHF